MSRPSPYTNSSRLDRLVLLLFFFLYSRTYTPFPSAEPIPKVPCKEDEGSDNSTGIPVQQKNVPKVYSLMRCFTLYSTPNPYLIYFPGSKERFSKLDFGCSKENKNFIRKGRLRKNFGNLIFYPSHFISLFLTHLLPLHFVGRPSS